MRGADEIGGLQERWFELAESTSPAGLTLYPDYTMACLGAFDTFRDETLVAAAFLEDRLVAVLPARFTTRKASGISAAVLEFPDYPAPIRDVLISASVPARGVFQSLLSQLAATAGTRWDYTCFRGVLESSTLIELAGQMKQATAVHYDYSHRLCVETGDYVGSVLKSKARNNLRRNRKKLASRGSFEFRTVDAFPELEAAYQAFLVTEAAGWKSVRGGKRAIALHDDQTAFYRDLLARHAGEGRSHIHLLYLDGTPIASDLCIQTADSCYSLKHGYDEAYADMAPGNLLREYTVNYYGERDDVRFIDLLSGMKWHLSWQPERRRVYEVRFYNSTVKAGMMGLMAAVKRSLRPSPDPRMSPAGNDRWALT